ncbi:MAG: class I SAM-dependent methyltransferase [Bdellovibrionota bacterium]
MSFTEEDIRPKEFDEGKKKALHEDIEWLKTKKDEFVEVLCPACNADKNPDFLEKYTFQFKRCIDCRTVYMSPRPTEEIIAEFFATSKIYEYWSKYIFPATLETRREKLFKPRAERIVNLCNRRNHPTNCLMEVGPGYGTFCEELKKLNVFNRIIAVEPHKDLADNCRSLGLEVIESTIEQVDLSSNKPDIILLFEVIATLFKPELLFQACARNMDKGGLFVVTCPNYEGLDMLELGANSDSVDNENINLFNPDSMTILMERCGFKVVELETPGELDVGILRDKALSGIYDASKHPFLEKILLEKFNTLGAPLQEFLKTNQLSSSMWIVAEKT